MERLSRILLALTLRSDIALAILIVLIIFMMILPMPTTVIDGLIALNMGISVLLLMVAVYLTSPLGFAAFPTVLLLTTLFRLALAISTTRLILLQADAGRIIQTFGEFVVGGNLVVGLVVFLILTIVQFIVITKGAERVAEVGARFSLDAMPGKQMSIDGDMRAGVIDQDEATRRRRLLEKESQLYGAMDGAMKFVKGDAIAGIIIVAVNLIGGLTIGTLQQGMPMDEAMQTYSILTIGDGLIQQIPALFVSITAGIIVTRVASETGPANLGSEIMGQLLAQPKALLIAAAILLGFGLVPGFPMAIFFGLGFLVGTAGFTLQRLTQKAVKEGAPVSIPGLAPAEPAPKRGAEEGEFVPTVPLLIDISAASQRIFDAAKLEEEVAKVRRALYYDLGVQFPGIGIRHNERLAEGNYTILIQEVPITQGALRDGCVFVRDTVENLELLAIEHETDRKFLPDLPTVWAPDSRSDRLRAAGIPFMEPAQVLAYHLGFMLRKYAGDFVGIQETRRLLEQMEARFPDLVKEVQRMLSLQKITEILQRLASEDMSIRNLRAILEALVEWGQKEKDTVLLVEYIRSSLRRYISYKYSAGQNILPAYLFTPDVEDTIRSAVRQTNAGSYLSLDPGISRGLIASIKQAVGNISERAQQPVLLTSMDIRRYVRKLIEIDIYELPVLSYQELTQEITIQPLGRISLGPASAARPTQRPVSVQAETEEEAETEEKAQAS